jgi:hypothetical protein
LALREIGRLERTLFLLEWLRSPELRHRVQAGLNKAEARNALARAVFFYRLGRLRDRALMSVVNKVGVRDQPCREDRHEQSSRTGGGEAVWTSVLKL